MTSFHALFFLRQYNDIDHITPVIARWAQDPAARLAVVVATQSALLDDYRVKHLRAHPNCALRHIDEFLSDAERAARPARPAASSMPDPYFSRTQAATRMLDWAFPQSARGPVIFDWIKPVNLVQDVLVLARARGLPTVSLPHGDSPYHNLMENIDDLNYDLLERYREQGGAFDYVVVPNALCARRYSRYLGPDRLKTLGSPRYNPQWMQALAGLLPRLDLPRPPGALTLAFFLRPMDYAIQWDEVVRTMRLVLQFPAVHLTVKHHTRENSVAKLVQTFPDLREQDNPRIRFVYNEVHSSALIDWADVILDLGTSATFEAVLKRKPVLALEYMQANYLTISHYLKAAEMKCRDDLYDTIQRLAQSRDFASFYDPAEHARFVREVVGPPERDILADYVAFLKELAT